MPVSRSAASITPISRQPRPVASIGAVRAARQPARRAEPAARDDSPRVLLPITLEGDADYLCAQRRVLLRSPLGVYVSHIDAHRERMAVWFDLARADVGFAIHTLLSTVPNATLGSLRQRMS